MIDFPKIKRWIRKIEGQNRMRLPIEIADYIPWIKKTQNAETMAIAIPGLLKGVQRDNALRA